MKWWIIRISLLLILGVVTTLGVAWGLAFGDWPTEQVDSESAPREFWAWWRAHVPTDWAIHPGGFATFASHACEVRLGTEYSEGESASRGTLGNNATQFLVGWPCRSMSGGMLVDRSTREVQLKAAMYVEGFWFVPNARLPLRPIFPGFLINTLFYAAMWFGIFFGVATLRRLVRKKRGRCVKCGYDLRGQRAGGHLALGNRHSGGDKDTTGTQMPNAESRMPSSTGCPECGWGREI